MAEITPKQENELTKEDELVIKQAMYPIAAWFEKHSVKICNGCCSISGLAAMLFLVSCSMGDSDGTKSGFGFFLFLILAFGFAYTADKGYTSSTCAALVKFYKACRNSGLDENSPLSDFKLVAQTANYCPSDPEKAKKHFCKADQAIHKANEVAQAASLAKAAKTMKREQVAAFNKIKDTYDTEYKSAHQPALLKYEHCYDEEIRRLEGLLNETKAEAKALFSSVAATSGNSSGRMSTLDMIEIAAADAIAGPAAGIATAGNVAARNAAEQASREQRRAEWESSPAYLAKLHDWANARESEEALTEAIPSLKAAKEEIRIHVVDESQTAELFKLLEIKVTKAKIQEPRGLKVHLEVTTAGNPEPIFKVPTILDGAFKVLVRKENQPITEGFFSAPFVPGNRFVPKGFSSGVVTGTCTCVYEEDVNVDELDFAFEPVNLWRIQK